MQKRRIFQILFVFLLLANFVHALDETTIRDAQDKLDNAGTIIGGITDPEQREDFLKEQWILLLSNTTVGKAVVETGKVLSPINPFVELIVGVKVGFTLLFFMALFIWIKIALTSNKVLRIFDLFNNSVRLILAIGISVITALIGLNKLISLILTNIILMLPQIGGKIIGVIAVVFIIQYISTLVNILEKQAGIGRNKKKQEELKRRVEELESKEKKTPKETAEMIAGRTMLEEIGKGILEKED